MPASVIRLPSDPTITYLGMGCNHLGQVVLRMRGERSFGNGVAAQVIVVADDLKDGSAGNGQRRTHPVQKDKALVARETTSLVRAAGVVQHELVGVHIRFSGRFKKCTHDQQQDHRKKERIDCGAQRPDTRRESGVPERADHVPGQQGSHRRAAGTGLAADRGTGTAETSGLMTLSDELLAVADSRSALTRRLTHTTLNRNAHNCQCAAFIASSPKKTSRKFRKSLSQLTSGVTPAAYPHSRCTNRYPST